jgi:antitoxin ParD1/3/4
MTMARLNISLPRTLLKYVETQVHGGGYSTPSEYFRSLIRDDQKRKAAGRIEALLIEGLASGKPIAVNSAFWNKKRSALTSRHCNIRE